MLSCFTPIRFSWLCLTKMFVSFTMKTFRIHYFVFLLEIISLWTRASKIDGGFQLVFPTLVDKGGKYVSNDIQDYSNLHPFAFPHFKAFGHTFTLHLNQNNLLTNDFFVEKITSSKQALDVGNVFTLRKDQDDGKADDNCYFVGFVKGSSNSTVAVNTCNGLNGVIVVNTNEYYIEPISIHANYKSELGAPHAMYKRSWLNLPTETNDDLLVAFDETWSEDKDFPLISLDQSLAASLTPGDHGVPRRGHRSLSPVASIETLVVADKTMVDFHGEKHVKNYVLTVMNMVSNIFRDRSIGRPINVVIVRLIIIEKEQQNSFTVSFSAKSTLQSFCSWQKRQNFVNHQHPYHHDVAVLFTRKNICGLGNFPCASIGMAMQRGMCNSRYSCNVVQDTGLNTAFTVAQMLGHNIGLTSLKRTSCGALGAGSYIMSTLRLRSPYTNRFKWSSCSRAQLARLLRGRTGKCLLDAGSDNEQKNLTLPGQQYSLDDQCRFIHGQNVSFCQSRTREICKTLWCTRDFHQRGCTTNREPAAEGSSCDNDGTKWCIGGNCVSKVSKLVPVDGKWGSWSEWSVCSRSCGAGVQKATRECNNPRPSFKGKPCQDERLRYQICNTEDCPPDGIGFRDAQCAAFNSRPYRGRLYKWKGFHTPGKECSLICKAEKHRFYVLMNAHVADGTPCRQGSYDRCIAGECKKVGCDFGLGSTKTEDVCGHCGGNGTSCKLVNKDYKKKHGLGYVIVVYIPSGSTSINIVENTPSRNFLAIETIFGKNILNGGYMIERPGSYNRLKSIVEYHRIGMLERIQIKGPISTDIKIMVLFQADSSSISLQYAEQNGANRALFKSRDRYIWKHDKTSKDAWSACSATCGRGLHNGQFECLDIFTNKFVDKSNCDKNEKPFLVKACANLPPCKKPKPTGKWTHGTWAPCSASCGEGTKTRIVACTKDGTNLIINEKFCKGRKPKILKKCNRTPCKKELGIWVFGQWGRCSVTCGGGVRQRLVKCVNLAGKMLVHSHCDGFRKPAETVRCGVPCVKWVAGEWGKCPSSCKEKQRRCILCINMHTFTNSKECKDSEKPTEERTCPASACS